MDGIMVSIATGAMNSLLGKLTMMLEGEYNLQQDVKANITFLKDELCSMSALLEKLADKEELDPQMKDWRDQVREMGFDIEDSIDEHLRLGHMPEKPSSILGFFVKYIDKVKKLVGRHDIALQIQELKARVIEASDRRKRYKLDVAAYSDSTNVASIDPRLPALYVEANSLVGIDGPTNEIIKLVADEEQGLKVVSVVGFAGLGKTTLANQVYKSIAGQFKYRAFVSVSLKPDMRKILSAILSQMKKDEHASTGIRDEDWLINEIRDFLKERRYFVVIDDIWSSEAWGIIKCALLENACGSRIIVTTRNATVAKTCCFPDMDLVYEVRPLSEADSKSLFFGRTFASEDQCPLHLKDVSIDIIKKCHGLPMAIITMSSLLSTKSERREDWVSIRDSIGLGPAKDPGLEVIRRVLSLSYRDLPHHLKTCLLYLGMYPEDHEFYVPKLIRRWISEGFIKVTRGRNLQEEGESYFNELVNRGVIQPFDFGRDGRVTTCRVHDMILDIIISKATEENFITFWGDTAHTSISKGRARRLFIDYRDQENVMDVSSTVASHVRSLVVFEYCEHKLRIADFQALRVLFIHSSQKLHLKSIGNLFQLRYLQIESYGTTRLPEQIGELYFLETLDICKTNVTKLPASIVKLQHLKYIIGMVKLPNGIGKMQSLEKLLSAVVDDRSSAYSLKELGDLTGLRILGLHWRISDSHCDRMTCITNLASSLAKLGNSNLQCLTFHCYSANQIQFNSWSPPPHLLQKLRIKNTSLCGIPEWMASLANLTELAIMVDQVTQSVLQILGGLSALLYLELWSEAAAETLMVCNAGFRALKHFHMHSFVKGLMFKDGSMMKLQSLSFDIMAQGMQSASTHLDFGIHHLSALKKLTVGIICEGARVEEVEALESAIAYETSLLPNCPTPLIERWMEKKMVKNQAGKEGERHIEHMKEHGEIPRVT
ncbi:hypothetical protein ACP70R_049566 [Stipagrostis hirtigluma subsp. patula]